jgi:acetylglutamate kinase
MLVLKVGGNEIDDPEFLAGFARAIAALSETPIVVHGGGKEIADLQTKLGLTPRFVDGLRVTDEASLAVVEMVLSGRVNKRVVAALLGAGVDAIGLSGVDRGLVRAEKMTHPAGDLGRVGRVVSVRAGALRELADQRVVPVLSPISLGDDGPYNVNADSVASAVARALGAEAVVFVTNVPGVLREGQVIATLSSREAEALIEEKVVNGGMIPKVRAALDALSGGTRAARITNLAGLVNGGGTLLEAEAA